MTKYALAAGYQQEVLAYPYSLDHLMSDNPNTSFPRPVTDTWLHQYNIYVVAETPLPAFDPATQNVVETTPVWGVGNLKQAWTVVPASAAEIAARAEEAADTASREAIKADAWVRSFAAMTPAQVSTYINNNVTSLATAKPVIEKLARMVHGLVRRELRQ